MPPTDDAAPTPTIPVCRSDNIKYEQDADGNLIPDVNTEWRYTAETKQFIREEMTQLIGAKMPMKKLPHDLQGYRVDPGQHRDRILPRLQFGLGVNNDHLINYGERKNLTTQKEFLNKIRISLDIARTIVGDLGKACGAKLQLREPDNIEYMYAVCIYDSYTPLRVRPKGEERDGIIKAIQRELNIQHGPLWYFDIRDPPEDYFGLGGYTLERSVQFGFKNMMFVDI